MDQRLYDVIKSKGAVSASKPNVEFLGSHDDLEEAVRDEYH
jgi:hypothetical protein